MPSFAFSIHNFISSVGADAGFAAIIGLAVLVLLYFAHARETANLREDAALLTQRLQRAEARVVQLTRMQSSAEGAAEIAAQQAAPAVAIAPFAPAGMGAPALASATRVVPAAAPAAAPVVEEQRMVTPVPAMAMVGVAGAQPISAARVPAAPPPAIPGYPPASRPPFAPDERTSAADEQAVEAPPAQPGMPAPATNAGGNGGGHHFDVPEPVPAASGGPSSRASLSARQSSRPLPPLEYPRVRRRSRLGRGVVVALVALVVVVAAVVLFALTGVGGSNPSPSASTTNAPSGAARAAFKPSSVTVAVLNGTAVNQLAHRISDRLAALGYKPGTIATASNQTERSTIVAYLPGSNNRTDAEHVASALRLRRSAVQRVDQGTLQVACPTPSGCTAKVVVTVGADLASQ